MRVFWRRAAGVRLGICLAAGLATGLAVVPVVGHAENAGGGDMIRQMRVQGTGRVSLRPDMATVTLGVSHQARDAAAAMAQTSATMQALFETASAAGIAEADMQTSNLSLNARYDHSNSAGAPRLVGYVATHTLALKLRDIGLVGAQLDHLLTAGANQFHGIVFDLEDRKAAQVRARQLAVAQALAKAAQYADAAGVETGAVLLISDGAAAGFGPGPGFGANMLRAEAVPVAAGTLDITAQVTLVIEIR